MTFEPKTFPVNLAMIREPHHRSHRVIQAIWAAEAKIGTLPTHVLCDSHLKIDIEILDFAGLRVKRMPFGWSSHYLVRLAVAEPELRPMRGGPKPLAVQGRLV